jgi:hypothetical protein
MIRRFIIGIFKDESSILKAVKSFREEGVSIVETYTPYAVHGLDKAMGLAPSRIFLVILSAVALGCGVALGFQYWASVVSWPVVTGGKTGNLLPAFIPVTFEVTVLFGGLASVAALFYRSKLRWGSTPHLKIDRVTDDRFALVLDGQNGRFDQSRLMKRLKELGAIQVEERIDSQ